MTNVNYSPLAMKDLQSIHEYIATDLGSPQAARNTVSRIAKSIRLLEGSPEIGTPLSAICDVISNYRFLVSGKYLVFYRYTENTAYVIRVLYGGMNYLSVLFNDIPKDDANDLYS